jgi:hypothetical protein
MSVTPFFAHCSNSDAFIGREALATSGVLGPTPLQNSLMPPPVPRLSTRGALLPLLRAKVSATRVVNGKTVEEPAAQM